MGELTSGDLTRGKTPGIEYQLIDAALAEGGHLPELINVIRVLKFGADLEPQPNIVAPKPPDDTARVLDTFGDRSAWYRSH